MKPLPDNFVCVCGIFSPPSLALKWTHKWSIYEVFRAVSSHFKFSWGEKKLLVGYNENCTGVEGRSWGPSLMWPRISLSVKHKVQLEDDLFYSHSSETIEFRFQSHTFFV